LIAVPWGWLGNKEVFESVMNGERLTKPKKCPDRVYEIMKKCWLDDPNARPSFKDLLQQLREVGKTLFPVQPGPTRTQATDAKPEMFYDNAPEMEYM
jgi:hypothetical protein